MLLSLLALAAAAALGAERATRAPELRVVDARAGSIRSADGALLAAHEFDGPAELRWVRPISLRPVSRPLRLREDFVSEFALSPDGGRIAVASEMHSRIEFFDLRRWRSLGSMRLMGERGYGGVSGLVWASERRLLALAGPAYSRVTPVVIDPERRRVVHRAAWRGRRDPLAGGRRAAGVPRRRARRIGRTARPAAALRRERRACASCACGG